MYSVEPVLTVCVNDISRNSGHVALLAGVIFSASGLANILAAPRLGKLSDRIGAHKVMLAALLVAGILFIPQALARNPWELMGLRFCWDWLRADSVPRSTHSSRRLLRSI